MTMDDTPITLTTLILLLFVVVAIIILLLHYLTNREQLWSRKYKEEKISLATHKLFKPNGYMIHSGSELLLSSSGSFKRFDTVDKESCKHSITIRDAASPKHCTTPLWNLPQTDSNIPPQPLRPAPAPAPAPAPSSFSASAPISAPALGSSVNHQTKTVKFLFDCEKEIHSASDTQSLDGSDRNEMLSLSALKAKGQMLFRQREVDIPVLDAPPSTRPNVDHANAALSTPSIAVPRPIVPRKNHSQYQFETGSENSAFQGKAEANGIAGTTTITTTTNTNPFLQDTPSLISNGCIKAKLNNALNRSNILQSIEGNPFMALATPTTPPTVPPTAPNGDLSNRHRSLSQVTEIFIETDDASSTATTNEGSYRNPFTNAVKKVKSPYTLQKTISEDFLFRKIVPGSEAEEEEPAYSNGISSWNFSRLLTQEDLTFNLWRRNSSQSSLDSGTLSSMDSINMERALSCDFAESFLTAESTAYTQITGYLAIALHYDTNSVNDDGMDLIVSILEAKGLILPFQFDSLDTFVRIYLVPDQAGALQTTIVKNSCTPIYNESFSFWFKRKEKKHSLWFHLYHSGTAHTLIGEAEMEIGEMPKSITTWLPLTDSRKCNARWGELMFSLSYLPTAERLTIVIVKGRNLQLQLPNKNDPTILDDVHHIFVKVYLMDNAKKVLKKRTTMKRKDRCPVFNESIIFSLPPHNLTTAQLRLTVFGVVDDRVTDDGAGTGGTSSGGGGGGGGGGGNSIQPIGHVVAGSYATGKGLRHWHQMLSSLRKPVAMWHVLRRVTNQPIFTGGADAVVAAMQTTAQRAKRNSII